ncbi:MAG TPA: hypothetical protein ENJ95_18565 [Bacteroidetes bacterium]|nr:hypothetical protein [Bacteroidota bacterium]
MKNSTIVRYLGSLEGPEQRRFREFAGSPYFNKHEKTRELLDILTGLLQRKKPDLGRRQVYRKLFPGEEFDGQKLNNVVSFLLRLFARFCAIEKFESREWERGLTLLESGKSGRLPKLFGRTERQLKIKFEKNRQKDAPFFYANYRYYKSLAQRHQKENATATTQSLQLASDNLDLFFLIEKLRLSCEMLAQKEVISSHFELSFINALIPEIENRKEFKRQYAIRVYSSIFGMLKNPGAENFYQKLKKLMGEYLPFFSKQEGLDIFNHAQNFCVRQINLGNLSYVEELHDLYLNALENKLLIDNNEINEWVYANISSVACRLKKYGWAKSFLEEYKPCLGKAARENAYNYNLAFYHYQKKEYGPARQLLTNLEFTDYFYQFNSRNLLMKIYFEEKEWELLEYLLESFRIFLLRSKEGGSYHRKNNLNLIRMVKKLAKLKEGKYSMDKKRYAGEMKKMKGGIEKNKNILNKKWLLEQIGNE